MEIERIKKILASSMGDIKVIIFTIQIFILTIISQLKGNDTIDNGMNKVKNRRIQQTAADIDTLNNIKEKDTVKILKP